MENFAPLTQSIIDGDEKAVIQLVNEALEQKIDPQLILSKYMIPGMVEVGRMMAEEEYYIPEVLKSAKSMNAGVKLLEPLLAAKQSDSAGHVIIGTVDSDIHDIGKNLMTMLLKGNGFTVQDLGVSVPTSKFIEAVKETTGTVVLGMSALITPVLDEMPKVINELNEAGLRDRVKVIVGGAPVTQEYADSIGADGTAPDAASAVSLVKRLLSS